MRARSFPSPRPKKSLGQHYLRDENIARKIVSAIAPDGKAPLLEIGPGDGALTRHLLTATERLFLVELDDRNAELLRRHFLGTTVTVLHEDILETDLTALAREAGAPLRVVGNIPYNITSPILFHLLDHRTAVRDATIMMQREVARRLVARPSTKDYGILAVFFQLFANPQFCFDVPPTAFSPQPKVVSSVVTLALRDRPAYPLDDEAYFRRLIRAVFGTRRKMLRHSLRVFLDGIPLPERFQLAARPEELSVGELAALANDLYAACGAGQNV
jgi:16S rRNA (adenine1518-N6/adenine1519-N6)-dimethyltransferase